MDIRYSSSSFLQKCVPIPSMSPSPQSLFSKVKISSIETNERFTQQTHAEQKKSDHHIITPKRKQKQQSFLTTIFKSFDEFICNFLDIPLRPSIDPKHVLSGNFSPVDELPPTACTLAEGSLPPCLNGGAYIRNGPNPQFFPKGPHHLFDGDGMLHALTISQQGEPKFCSRFVKTYKYEIERETGSPVIPNLFSAFNGLPASLARCALTAFRLISGEQDPRRGIGNANTSLSLFSGKLFALAESDLPYEIKLNSEGDIITLGRDESLGEPYITVTAHPKIDAQTGEAFLFRQSMTAPFLAYFRINSEGVKQPEVPINSLKEALLVHDFAITENYAVFPENQIVIRPKEILKGKSPVRVDEEKVPRLGICPRYALDESEMWWVEMPGFNLLHAVNAWEEDGGDTIVLVATYVATVEYMLERMDLVQPVIERVEINVKAKTVTRRPVSSMFVEFGTINPAYVGRKNRYMYAAIEASLPKTIGVVKLDLSLSTTESEDCTVATHLYGTHCYGGEPFFVSREPNNPTAEEDDGYLVTYVHYENTKESQFVVMDAKSPTLGVVAMVKLPQRVPYGFHGIFVQVCDLKKL